MAARALLAIGREDLRSQILATFAELTEEIELLGVAENSADLLLGIEAQTDVDLVFIDDQIGTLPYLALTREVIGRAPDVGVVLLVSEQSVNTIQGALVSGARAVLDSPPSLEELTERLPQIFEWQRQIRTLSNHGAVSADEAGRLIAFTGVKGGTGTSTLALHTALLAAASNPERRVCLIDLDLQQRGLRQLIELPARRTISDLVSLADSLTGRNLDEASIVHRSGLRILLAPEHGEQSEDIDGQVARQILAAAKGHYDLLIVDAGSVVTEASAVGMEFANDLYLVTTPDVPSLRAAQDKFDLLERLQIAKDTSVMLLFNKVSSRNEVQPEFGSRMAVTGVCKVAIPEDWRRIEPAANALAPQDVEDGPFRRAIVALGRELRLAAAPKVQAVTISPVASDKAPRRGRRRARESGQVTIEAIAGLALALIILLVLVQVALMAFGTVVARRAADQAARVDSRGGTMSQSVQAGQDSTPGIYDVGLSRVSGDRFRADVQSPSIVPWVNRSVSAYSSAAPEG